MGDDTKSGEVVLGPWVERVAQSWKKLAQGGRTPTGPELAQELAQRLGVDERSALGLLQGMETLVRYAQAEVASDVVQEERASVRVALASVQPVLQARVQQRLDQVDQHYPEAWCDGCRRRMEPQGRRARTWSSTVGPLELTRRTHRCRPCGRGRAPAPEKIGLTPSDWTPGMEEVCTLMATTVPHDLAVGLLEQMLGIEISDKASKSMAQRRGEAVLEQSIEEARDINADEERWGVRPPMEGAAPAQSVIEVAYLEMDGVIVPTRQDVPIDAPTDSGRGGKGRRYNRVGREVKNAVLYTANACAQESESRACLLEKTSVSQLGEWLPLAMLIWVQMLKLGFDRAKLLVVFSDGSEWIRSVCAWLSLPVLLILDLYHVKKRIWEAATAAYGEATEAARQWAQAACQQVEDGHAREVIAQLPGLKTSCPKAREQIEGLETYLENNLDRMEYPRDRAMGLRVGSGAIESTNYHVTGARLKRPGMRWSEKGAAQMAALRADLFNGRWQQRTRQFLKAA